MIDFVDIEPYFEWPDLEDLVGLWHAHKHDTCDGIPLLDTMKRWLGPSPPVPYVFNAAPKLVVFHEFEK